MTRNTPVNAIKPVARRRPAGDGYARGAVVRQKILESAQNEFGARGFDAASLRDIASAAGVHAPVVSYYFEGKEGLYLACVAHQLAIAKQAIGTAIAAHRACYEKQGRFADPHAVLDELLDARAILRDYQKSSFGLRMFFARERLVGGEAYKLFHDGVVGPLVDVCSVAVGQLLRKAPASDEVRMHALAALGEVMFFFTEPHAVLWAMQKSEFVSDDVERLNALLQQKRRTVFGLS